ncbi:MAG: hypothetical protein COU25_03810 [Candidatus Levybacteria bacterium CG10_big_fil_rev_8_21_14_0_10_35_13]|nr:MAG: hypothetical protein COU25_03810 [Candidatus Levybacteria bacterium CG10_big_fil_rev_8_21_14_0_10_35_13]
MLNEEKSAFGGDNQNTNQQLSSEKQLPSNNPEQVNQSEHSGHLESRSIVAILLLVFMYPAGLIFMWFFTKWRRWLKLLLSTPIIIAIIGIIIILTSATGLYFRDRNLPSLSPTPTPLPVEILGDRVINQRAGYSVVVPEGWRLEYLNETETMIIFASDSSSSFGIGEIRFFDYMFNDEKNDYLGEPVSISVDGVNGIVQDYKGGLVGKQALVSINGKTYIFRISKDDPQNLKRFEQLLSSFKFTNYADETANWKTYTNEKYGFTLKYPPEWSIDDKKLNIINLGPLSTKNHIGETIPEYVSSYIVLSLFNSTQNTDLKTFKNLNPAVNPIWKEIMIDEINGLDVQHKGCVSGSCREILFQKDNTIYNFSEQNNLKELNQILSTLMFTN